MRGGEREDERETPVERSVSLSLAAAGQRLGAKEEGWTWLSANRPGLWILRAMMCEFQFVFLSCLVIWLCYPQPYLCLLNHRVIY